MGVIHSIMAGLGLERVRKSKLLQKMVLAINKDSKTEDREEEEAIKNIMDALLLHRASRRANTVDSSCEDSETHALVYLAAKLALIKNIKDTPAVISIIMEMYLCENSFNKIFVCSLYEPEFFMDITFWRGQLNDRKDCFELYQFLLHHANLANLELPFKNRRYRMVDFPVANPVETYPAFCALVALRPEVLKVLLNYGAEITRFDPESAPVNIHLQMELARAGIDPNPYVTLAEYMKNPCRCGNTPTKQRFHDCMDLVKNTRPQCLPGIEMPSLRHMARSVIRKQLSFNFMLPAGIDSLEIPLTLKAYLRLDLLD